MKLWKALTYAAITAVCCTGLYAFQRTADWGYQPETSNVKAEFAWSRLRYNSTWVHMGATADTAMGGAAEIGRAIIQRPTGNF